MENLFEISARDLRKQEKFLTTGCSKLDEKLKGGIACSGITQIYGAAGTGKTQLALQLSLSVQIPIASGGLDAGAIYICTDSIFPSRRLQQLIRKSDIAKRFGATSDKIFVQHISNMEQLEYCLFKEIPLFMNIHKIGLIIIDSIAGPYRIEDWHDESIGRAKSLRRVGYQLHKLCNTKEVCIFCVNQVTAVIYDYNKIYNIEQSLEQPSLGTSWLSMVTNSIHLYRRESRRYASIVSSYLPSTIIPFEVREHGVLCSE